MSTTSSLLDTVISWTIPILSLTLVVGVQILFWWPTFSSPTKPVVISDETKKNSNFQDKIGQDATLLLTRNSSTTKAPSSLKPLAFNTGSSNSALPPFMTHNDRNNDKDNNNNNTNSNHVEKDDIVKKDAFLQQQNDQWRCVCETGFLPPGLLKSFGGAEAMMRVGNWTMLSQANVKILHNHTKRFGDTKEKKESLHYSTSLPRSILEDSTIFHGGMPFLLLLLGEMLLLPQNLI